MNFNLMDLTAKQLTEIHQYFIQRDKVNLGCDVIGGSFPDTIATSVATCIINHNIVSTSDPVLIINDFSFHMTQALLAAGFQYQNIVLLFCNLKTIKENNNGYDDYISNIMRYHPIIKSNKLSIINIEGAKSMKFNLIIANPPYGIGNQITKSIIDNVDFDNYINLMPLSKYKGDNLYQHIRTDYGELLWEGDAQAIPHICLLSNNKINNFDYDTYELRYVFDQRFKKFWEQQKIRPLPYVEHICNINKKDFYKVNSRTSVCVGIFTPWDKVHSLSQAINKFVDAEAIDEYFLTECPAILGVARKHGGKSYEEYLWNIKKVDRKFEDVFSSTNNGNSINQTVTIFNSELEKDNFTKWWYSAELSGKSAKSGLASIILHLMNKTTGCPFSYAIPRVDWTRSWTDEEILKDYNFTDDEIKEILALGEINLCAQSGVKAKKAKNNQEYL